MGNRSPMTLEDHIGDIIRKARQAGNISKEAVAHEGGITLKQLEELEDSGKTSSNRNLSAIANLVGLNGAKLQRIADGWLPKGVDGGRWREVRQIETAQRLTVNCYLVWDEATREAALFD